MKKLSLKITAAMIAGIGLFATSVSAANRTVNCDKGQSIQEAVEKGQGSAAPLYIDVSGSCEEVVTIKRDDVTIDGGETATVIGTIVVEGGNRIIVREITITGPGPGAGAVGGNLKLIRVAITGNSGLGVLAADSAYVGMSRSIIQNNVTTGVLARQGSSVFIRETSISGHEDYGIILMSNSIGNVVSNSTISENYIGISARNSSTVIVNNSDVLNNTNSGIEADNGATVVIDEGTTISSNPNYGIDASLHSSVLIGGDSAITNNGSVGIKLQSDSGSRIDDDVTISGNDIGNGNAGVFCTDTESSVLMRGTIADFVVCSDFNQVDPTP